MALNIKIGNKEIGSGLPTFIIAEAGSNHNGNLDQAKKLIDAAADAGADAVKFQLFKGEKLYPKNCGIVDSPMGKIDFFKVLKNMELPLEWLSILKDYSVKKRILFLCTAFDEESADALDGIGIEAHKLGSPELNHIPLIEHIAATNKPLIMSTGLCTIGEVEEALYVCYKLKNRQIVFLHCVSAYPTPFGECNLNILKTLKTVFDVSTGFSDHTSDPIVAPVIAVAMGADIIEKHFTLSKNLEGPDHSFALEPHELKALVEAVRKVEKEADKIAYVIKLFGEKKVETVSGLSRKIITKTEQEIYPNDKRSIHAITKIKKGEKITKDNTAVLRSERNLVPGMHPRFYKMILGKTVNKNIVYSQGVVWDDLLVS
jgi:sialic acid synthase SpsE